MFIWLPVSLIPSYREMGWPLDPEAPQTLEMHIRIDQISSNLTLQG